MNIVLTLTATQPCRKPNDKLSFHEVYVDETPFLCIVTCAKALLKERTFIAY